MDCLLEVFDPIRHYRNICACLVLKPSLLLFLCDENSFRGSKKAQNERILAAAIDLLKARVPGLTTQVERLDFSSPECVRQSLHARLKGYEKIVFEIAGGNERINLLLKDYADQHACPMIEVDNEKGKITDWAKDSDYAGVFDKINFSIKESIALAGARLVYTARSSPDEALWEGLLICAEAVIKRSDEWMQLNQYICRYSATCENRLELSFNGPERTKGSNAKFSWPLMGEMFQQGLIEKLGLYQGRICFSYANEFARQCLHLKGSWLELYLYILAKQSGLFFDVRYSAQIDWDGKIESQSENEVTNEIDLILSKSMIPHFISCKDTGLTTNNLIEIDGHSARFGSERSKAFLVTSQKKSQLSLSFVRRAEAMGVGIVSAEQLNRADLLTFFQSL